MQDNRKGGCMAYYKLYDPYPRERPVDPSVAACSFSQHHDHAEQGDRGDRSQRSRNIPVTGEEQWR